MKFTRTAAMTFFLCSPISSAFAVLTADILLPDGQKAGTYVFEGERKKDAYDRAGLQYVTYRNIKLYLSINNERKAISLHQSTREHDDGTPKEMNFTVQWAETPDRFVPYSQRRKAHFNAAPDKSSKQQVIKYLKALSQAVKDDGYISLERILSIIPENEPISYRNYISHYRGIPTIKLSLFSSRFDTFETIFQDMEVNSDIGQPALDRAMSLFLSRLGNLHGSKPDRIWQPLIHTNWLTFIDDSGTSEEKIVYTINEEDDTVVYEINKDKKSHEGRKRTAEGEHISPFPFFKETMSVHLNQDRFYYISGFSFEKALAFPTKPATFSSEKLDWLASSLIAAPSSLRPHNDYRPPFDPRKKPRLTVQESDSPHLQQEEEYQKLQNLYAALESKSRLIIESHDKLKHQLQETNENYHALIKSNQEEKDLNRKTEEKLKDDILKKTTTLENKSREIEQKNTLIRQQQHRITELEHAIHSIIHKMAEQTHPQLIDTTNDSPQKEDHKEIETTDHFTADFIPATRKTLKYDSSRLSTEDINISKNIPPSFNLHLVERDHECFYNALTRASHSKIINNSSDLRVVINNVVERLSHAVEKNTSARDGFYQLFSNTPSDMLRRCQNGYIKRSTHSLPHDAERHLYHGDSDLLYIAGLILSADIYVYEIAHHSQVHGSFLHTYLLEEWDKHPSLKTCAIKTFPEYSDSFKAKQTIFLVFNRASDERNSHYHWLSVNNGNVQKIVTDDVKTQIFPTDHFPTLAESMKLPNSRRHSRGTSHKHVVGHSDNTHRRKRGPPLISWGSSAHSYKTKH